MGRIVAPGEIVEVLERVLGPARRTSAQPEAALEGPMFVHEIAASLGVSIGEASKRVSQWELAGLVRLREGMVEPVT